jgi:hypothetical protein
MATARDEEIEAEARAMLRETIQRSGWYRSLPEEERTRRIEQDVDQNWPMMLQEARKRLEQRAGS